MKYFISTIFIIMPSLAFSYEVPEPFHLVRPNSIGGAFTAIANDENAIWTNPAGIARIRKARSRKGIHLISFPNLIFGANTESQSFIQGISSRGNQDNLESLADNFSVDKPLWSSVSAFPLIMFEFGKSPSSFGAFTHTKLKATVSSSDNSIVNTEAISDIGSVFTMAYTNRTNRFNMGLSLRYTKRYAFEEAISVATLADTNALQREFKENSNATSAFAVDAGMLFTLSDFWFPTFGIAVMDLPISCKNEYLNPFSQKREKVCGTVFKGSISNPDALSVVEPTNLKVGFSITPRLSRKLALRIALDMHHIHTNSGIDNYGLKNIPLLKQLHAGVELVTGNPLLPAPLYLAMGVNQGFYTMGWGFKVGGLAIDFSTFGRDISSSIKPVEDRRVMGGLSYHF
jgi:hypothetical protein